VLIEVSMGIITISSLSEVTMASTRFIQWPFVPMTLHCVPVVLCPRPSLVFWPVMIAAGSNVQGVVGCRVGASRMQSILTIIVAAIQQFSSSRVL
jgi:hypothetical protein